MELLKNCNDFLTVNEVYGILPIGKTKIYSLIRDGSIKSKKVGNKYVIPKTSIIRFFEYGTNHEGGQNE